MPGRYRGSTQVHARFLGSQRITARYLGSALVWSSTRIVLDFDGPNMDLDDTGDWVDLGSATDYKAAIHDGMMRLDLPDGLLVQMHRTSQARYDTQHPTDDGFIEVVPGTKGNGTPPIFSGATYTTEVFRRGNNTGSTATHGVGIRMRESRLFIVRNVAGTKTEMADCGSFAANDRLRLKQAGNVHTMYRNGHLVGAWDDAGSTAQKGANYRSLIVRVDASKDLLGPRRFSPAVDSIECS